jgi:2-deoxy-D-gluconate 3-dehydrogenase
MMSVSKQEAGLFPTVSELFSLRGKTAICTGGTGGLGLAMTIALAEAGADIISLQLRDDPQAPLLEEGVKACGASLSVFEADLSDSAALRACFANIWKSRVTPDILLNCAGINRRGKSEELKDEDIDMVRERASHNPGQMKVVSTENNTDPST